MNAEQTHAALMTSDLTLGNLCNMVSALERIADDLNGAAIAPGTDLDSIRNSISGLSRAMRLEISAHPDY